MPLESGKSKKAFSHNVRAEMHAGKPQNQAVAIAYHEAGEKKAHGGEVKHNYKGMPCMACGGAVCNLNYGHLRDQVEKERMGGDSIGKGMEGHGLGRMAAGGMVAPEDDAGKAYGPGSGMAIKKGEMMPLGYAKGGMYADGGPVSPAPQPTPMDDVGPHEQQARNALAGAFGGKQKKMAEGGEVDEDGDMLMDQCAHECMEAMKSGDKMAFKDAMMAMVHEVMEKMGKE